METKKPIRVVFAGTPHFAVPFLYALIKDPDFQVVSVITQPDRPVGRKQIFTPSPIKEVARENAIAILQPELLRKNKKIVFDLMDLAPDLLIVVAYGQIVPPEVLAVAKFGNINVHPSLLPKYRGSSPIQSAILNGDDKTGVTIMLMDEKLDHGPILSQKEFALSGQETGDSLLNDTAKIGTPLLVDVAKKFVNGEIEPTKQDDDLSTICKTINKDNAKIDWTKPAKQIEREIRAYYSWPISWTTLSGKRLKIFPATTINQTTQLKPGEIAINNSELSIGCGQGSLIISKLQLEGKEITSATDFIRGNKDIAGQILI